MHLGDMRMPQTSQQVSLQLKAFHHRAARKAIPQHLHCHRPGGHLLLRLVYPPHAPLTKQANDRHAAEIAAGYEIDNLFAIKAKRVRLARKLSGEAVRLLSRRGRSGGEIHSDKASHKPTVTPCWKRDVLRQLCRTIELSAFLKDGSAAVVKILLRPTACAKSDSRAAMISRIRCRLPAGWRPGSTRRQRRS